MHDHLTYTSIGRQDLHLLSGGNAKHHLSAVFVVPPLRIGLSYSGLQPGPITRFGLKGII